MNCPVCNAVMVDVTVPRITSGFIWQRYRCEPCKVTARVEITFSCDDDSPSPYIHIVRGETMSLLQTFRDGINPAWKEIWRDIASIAVSILRITMIIIMCVEYSRGNFPKATFYAVMVVWMTVAERSSSNG